MRKDRTQWELADMVDSQGRLGRPASEDLLSPPDEIQLDDKGEWVEWRKPSTGSKPMVAAPATLLDEFIELGDGPPDRILRFARRWGVLDLCVEHNFPGSHVPSFLPIEVGIERPCESRTKWEDGWWVGKEPVEVWKQFAREARSILTLAARLQLAKSGEKIKWLPVGLSGFQRVYEEIDGQIVRRAPDPESGGIMEAVAGRERLADEVNGWLSLANIYPVFAWSEEDPKYNTLGGKGIRLAYDHSVFGALTLQLLFAVSRTKGLAFCSNCSRPYIPKRRPVPGRRSYCHREECLRARGRDASRDRYAREKAKKR
jgi:hypothetical protein